MNKKTENFPINNKSFANVEPFKNVFEHYCSSQ